MDHRLEREITAVVRAGDPDARLRELMAAAAGGEPLGEPWTVEVRSEYFDTPAGELARAGASLTRLTRGGESVWKLKRSAGEGPRSVDEWVARGDGAALPAALAAKLPAATGLQPLLTMRQRRTYQRWGRGPDAVLTSVDVARATDPAGASADAAFVEIHEEPPAAGFFDAVADRIAADPGLAPVASKLAHFTGALATR